MIGMSDKEIIEKTLTIRDLTLEVQNKIIDKVNKDFNDITRTELCIIDDDFVIKPEDSSYSHFYMKINRSNYEVLEFRTEKKYSLQVINEVVTNIIGILKEYEENFNKVFGIKLETIDDFVKHCEFLIDASIEKRYVIGKLVKRSYSDSYDEYGIIFDPSCFFSIEYTDEDKKYYGKSHMRCYVEFDKDTIDTKELADFLIKIVLKNKETIEKYIEESKNEQD